MSPQTETPQPGFTLIEVAIATLLLLVAAVGTLPLLSRALADNVWGHEASTAAALASAALEDLGRRPLDHPSLKTVETGRRSWSETLETGSPSEVGPARWVPAPAGSGGAFRWRRSLEVDRLVVRRFLDEDADGVIDRLELAEDPGSALDEGAVEVMALRVVIMTDRRQGALRRQPALRLQLLRTF